MVIYYIGLHRRASNLCSYGDTGRYPLMIATLPQCIKYFRRVANKSTAEPTSLVGCAFVEQQKCELDWYNTWNGISTENMSPDLCKNLIANSFESEWNSKRATSNKLAFYNSVKTTFGREPYLSIDNVIARKSICRLRASAHDLRVETGRYITKNKVTTMVDRTCRYCCFGSDWSDLVGFEALPYFDPIIESEPHVLTECPGYHHLRYMLSDELKSNLLLCQYGYIMQHPILAKELGIYLTKSFNLRNPKKDIKKA